MATTPVSRTNGRSRTRSGWGRSAGLRFPRPRGLQPNRHIHLATRTRPTRPAAAHRPPTKTDADRAGCDCGRNEPFDLRSLSRRVPLRAHLAPLPPL